MEAWIAARANRGGANLDMSAAGSGPAKGMTCMGIMPVVMWRYGAIGLRVVPMRISLKTSVSGALFCNRSQAGGSSASGGGIRASGHRANASPPMARAEPHSHFGLIAVCCGGARWARGVEERTGPGGTGHGKSESALAKRRKSRTGAQARGSPALPLRPTLLATRTKGAAEMASRIRR